MANLKSIKTENLRALIDETESTLEELHAELDRREEAAQHTEIDKLDEHMRHAEVSLTSIRDFIAQMLREMRTTEKT